MLIKVQTAPMTESFFMVDHVENVRYDSNPEPFNDTEQLSRYLFSMSQMENCRVIVDPAMAPDLDPKAGSTDPEIPQNRVGALSEKRVYRLNVVTYHRNGEYHSIVFDSIAYICNDEGKTLERAHAGGILNYQ